MTYLTILSWLKGGLVYGKKVLAFIWSNKAIMVIALLIAFIGTLRYDMNELIDEKEAVVQEFHEYKINQEMLLLQQQIKNKQVEVDLLSKQSKIEGEYNAKVKELQDDLATTRSNANRLSNTANVAKQRADTSECEEVRSYAKTSTELLEDVSSRRDYYAEQADKHANAEVKAVEQHNALVDALNEYNASIK